MIDDNNKDKKSLVPLIGAKPSKKKDAKAVQWLKVNPADIRHALNLTQTEFWEPMGLSQSAGSKYETGERRMPPSLQFLIRIVYIDKIDLDSITRDIVEVGKHIQKTQPELWQSLLQQVKIRRKQ